MAESVTPIEKANKFKRIEDPLLCRNLIAEAIGSHAAANCMGLPEQTEALKGKFTSDTDGKREFWIHLGMDSFTSQGKLLEIISVPLTVKFTVFIKDQPVLCFEAELIEIKGDRLKFKTPEKMFFLQRRKSRRYKVPAAYEIFVEHFDPHYERRLVQHKLYDISIGGLSFLVGAGESRFYLPGLKLNPVYVGLKGERHTLSLEVRVAGKELLRQGDTTGVLIGLRFEKIDLKTLDVIDAFVQEGMIRGQTGKTTLE